MNESTETTATLIPKEILRRVRELEIRTRRAVRDILAGQYSSVFRGQGIEFSEVRAYAPGDDVRTIDWNVTARFGHPFVKRFVEERELTVMLLLDGSASGAFGSGRAWKSERAAEAAALLAAAAIRNNDKVGLVVFTDRVEKYLRPEKGRSHVLRVIREALFFRPEGTRTRIASALEHVSNVQKRRAVVFLISDFIDSGYDDLLAATARRHDLVAVSITDPRELELPRAGLVTLEDAETGGVRVIDTSSGRVRRAYETAARERSSSRRALLRRSGVDEIRLQADRPAFGALLEFFRMREGRR
ncbi:MAG: DUF58 domain-containing protein [Planctomycetota bacterium]|jgi:uncharacterized protein (DUF58 family)